MQHLYECRLPTCPQAHRNRSPVQYAAEIALLAWLGGPSNTLVSVSTGEEVGLAVVQKLLA